MLAAMIVVIAATDLSAHRRDELLQAARIAIAPGRVELEVDLAPGITIADPLIAEIDRDRDGTFSRSEQTDYVMRVISDIGLAIDGRPLQVEPTVESFPDPAVLRTGDSIIRLRSTVALPRLSGGDHQLSFRNTHRPEISVYLANALVPDGDAIAISTQRRDQAQSDLTIDYTLRAAPTSMLPLSIVGVLIAIAAMLMVGLRRTTLLHGVRSRAVAADPL